MKRIMGIDYGTVRLGVALSDELQMLAHPAETISMNKLPEALARIAAIVVEKNVERIIVGLPRHLDGRMSESAAKAQEFAEKLRRAVSCEVETWDERLSTVAAQRSLREAGKSTRQSRGYVDQVAAQIFLQSYLDRLQHQRNEIQPESFA
jgi:putative Holliday junction resolvase